MLRCSCTMRNHLQKCPSTAAQDLRAAGWAVTALRFRAAVTCKAAQPRCTHKSGYNFGLQTQIGDHFRHIFLTTNSTNAVGTSRFHMWHQEFVSSLAPQGCQSGTRSSVTLFPLGETGKGINGTKIQLHSQSRCVSNFSKSNRLARQVCLRGEAPLTKSSR